MRLIPSPKKFILSGIGVLLSIGVFLFSIELLSSLLLMAGFTRKIESPPLPITSWETVKHSAESFGPYRDLANRILKFSENHPEIFNKANRNTDLLNELGKYPPIPVDSDIPLLLNGFLRPNLDNVYELRGSITDRVKYRVRYQTNEFGFRKLPQRESPSYNIIFLGCSFTFGEGLPGEKTFAGLIAEKFPKAQVYNYGLSGASPSSIKRILTQDSRRFILGLNNKLPTIIIFTFIDDHMRRVAGTSLYLQQISKQDEVNFIILPNGKIHDAGQFTDDPKNLRWLYKWLGSTQTAKVTKLELPSITEEHYLLTARLLLGIKYFYDYTIPNNSFYVSSFVFGSQTFPHLIFQLQRERLNFFDYGGFNFSELSGNQHTLAGDTHPSELTNLMQAELLETDIKEILRKKGL
jgi:hypothetical protein